MMSVPFGKARSSSAPISGAPASLLLLPPPWVKTFSRSRDALALALTTVRCPSVSLIHCAVVGPAPAKKRRVVQASSKAAGASTPYSSAICVGDWNASATPIRADRRVLGSE